MRQDKQLSDRRHDFFKLAVMDQDEAPKYSFGFFIFGKENVFLL